MRRLPNYLARSFHIAVGLWLTMMGFSTFAATSNLVSTNDLKKRADDVYHVSGVDPFLVIKLDSEAIIAGDIIVDLGPEVSDLKLELFFESRDSFFDPFYKASYSVDRFPVRLKLPSGALKASTLRIDLVNCPSCQLDLSTVVNADQSLTGSASLEPEEVLNGLAKLSSNGRKIELFDWRLNDLDGTLREFEITAGDPFFVSPKLNSSTHGLAGVYFRLSAPSSNANWDDYQFFYQTEHHGFSLKASANMRVSQSPNNHNSGNTELFIPLGFLSEDFPQSKLLEKIRLDLPIISGEWALLESKLIHHSQLEQYLEAKPKQLVHTKLQRATGLRLLKKSLINVWGDRGFVVAYLLLIIVSIVVFVRAYRR